MHQGKFTQRTDWLRPYTRWATRFAVSAPPWLPAPVRSAPLKLSTLVLRAYHRAMR